jgi:hypothetical protein
MSLLDYLLFVFLFPQGKKKEDCEAHSELDIAGDIRISFQRSPLHCSPETINSLSFLLHNPPQNLMDGLNLLFFSMDKKEREDTSKEFIEMVEEIGKDYSFVWDSRISEKLPMSLEYLQQLFKGKIKEELKDILYTEIKTSLRNTTVIKTTIDWKGDMDTVCFTEIKDPLTLKIHLYSFTFFLAIRKTIVEFLSSVLKIAVNLGIPV